MPRGKKSPTLKDAITHKKAAQTPAHAKPASEKAAEVKAEEEPKPQRAAKAAKQLPTLEEIVAKLKQHGIHFDN